MYNWNNKVLIYFREIAEKYWNLSINPGYLERKSIFELMLSYKESAYNKQGNQIIPQQQYIRENGEMKFLKMQLDEMESEFKNSGNKFNLSKMGLIFKYLDVYNL